jgi:flagellar protein FliO/FliZ
MKKPLLERLRSARVPVLVGALGALPVHATLQTVAPGTASEAASSGVSQAFLGMAAVLGLIFACSWLAKRFGLQRFTGGGHLVKVVSSTAVGQRERVVVVEVADTWVVLGVTPTQVHALYTLPAQAGQLGGQSGSAVVAAAAAVTAATTAASAATAATATPATAAAAGAMPPAAATPGSKKASASTTPGADAPSPAPVLIYPPVMAPAAASASDGMDPVMVFARKLHESLVRNTHLSTP